MFFTKRCKKLRVEKKIVSRIPTRWKLVLAGLLGSGTGLFIFTMWNPGAILHKFSCDKSTKEAPEIDYFQRAANARSSSVVEKPSPYCTIRNCDQVICSSISEFMNPGQVASDFITQTFTTQCPTSSLKVLTFESCAFPNNRLEPDWLSVNLPIEELTFSKCAIEDLTNGSFASTIFTNLNSLSLKTGKIRIFRKSTFDELKNLQNFIVEDNAIHEAEYDLLKSATDSLEVLSLNGCLRDIDVLANITSRGNLFNVKILSIQRNDLRVITSELFESMPNLVSIYLQESKIKNIEADTLRSTRSLVLLDLRNNLLEKLPPGLLNPVLTNNRNFRISMSDNPWNCSCDFHWIQEFLMSNPEKFTEIPRCEAPARNALSYFTSAIFCDYAINASTTQSTTIRDEQQNEKEQTANYVKFTCKNYETPTISRARRKLLSNDEEWKLPSRYPDFSVKSLENGDISINLRKNQYRLSLIWFENVDRETENIDDAESSMTIGCVNNVRDSFVLENLTFDTSYTICLLENFNELSSPLNCLAARTAAKSIDRSRSNNNVWLTNEEKSAVLSISISLLVIVSLLTALSSFLVIRRNPSLLRGSERIVMVRKRGIEALVMPKGMTSRNSRVANNWTNEKRSRDNCQANYLTLLENRKFDRKNSAPWESSPRRKESKVSRISSYYSAGSYVSGIEATPSELYNWRNTARIRNYCNAPMENEEFDATPTIPSLPEIHRSIDAAIPSLSLAVDSRNPPSSPRRCHIEERASPNFREEQ